MEDTDEHRMTEDDADEDTDDHRMSEDDADDDTSTKWRILKRIGRRR